MTTIIKFIVRTVCARNYLALKIGDKTAYVSYFNPASIVPVFRDCRDLRFEVLRGMTSVATGHATGFGNYYLGFETESVELFHPKRYDTDNDISAFAADKLEEGDILKILSTNDLLKTEVEEMFKQFLKTPIVFEDEQIIVFAGAMYGDRINTEASFEVLAMS